MNNINIDLNKNSEQINDDTSIKLNLQWNQQIDFIKVVNKPNKFPSLKSIFHLNRLIESHYHQLPWPTQIKHVTILTQVQGGKGDIAAGAKVINLLNKIHPSLSFDWILTHSFFGEDQPESYLDFPSTSLVNVKTKWQTKRLKDCDLIIVGPVKNDLSIKKIQEMYDFKVLGPLFNFWENSTESSNQFQHLSKAHELTKDSTEAPLNIAPEYRNIHKELFTVQNSPTDGLQMSLMPGTGVFIDEARANAPLSRLYCCPSYLSKLENKQLKKDILTSLGVTNPEAQPDYDHYSLNSGYAHRPASWMKFIDFVALHEKRKNVTIVLNQKGISDDYSTSIFSMKIFSPERINFLKKCGFGSIKLKGESEETQILLDTMENNNRQLHMIIRPSFLPIDMKHLQLASERLLATGDNTASEAWASRCKLYLYENVGNGGCKKTFLKQQIELATSISPSLGQLLEIFGNASILSESDMNRATDLLGDSQLSNDTLKFCNLIIQKFSFSKVLVSSLKRTLWNGIIPGLMDIEADAMPAEYKSEMMSYVNNYKTFSKIVKIDNLSLLEKRVHDRVYDYLKGQST